MRPGAPAPHRRDRRVADDERRPRPPVAAARLAREYVDRALADRVEEAAAGETRVQKVRRAVGLGVGCGKHAAFARRIQDLKFEARELAAQARVLDAAEGRVGDAEARSAPIARKELRCAIVYKMHVVW